MRCRQKFQNRYRRFETTSLRHSGVAHPRPCSHTLTRIAGDSTAMACFSPRPPRESEFATDRRKASDC